MQAEREVVSHLEVPAGNIPQRAQYPGFRNTGLRNTFGSVVGVARGQSRVRVETVERKRERDF